MNKEADARFQNREEDADLVKAFQAGNKKAFDSLVLKYEKKVFNVCFRFLGDYEDANDTAQETFVRVYRSLDRFRFDAAFSTWLFRIAVNTCKNKLGSLASRMRKKAVPLDRPKELENGRVNPDIADSRADPENAFQRKERMGRIQAGINTLSGDQQTLVILRDVQGLSYEEIGAITGLGPGTLKSKLSRARWKLREKLKDLL
jgi:RNA polymerase sigma-70 factor (ECF subfamily)